MTIASTDLHKAVYKAWRDSTLDELFEAERDSSTVDKDFPSSIYDTEATPGAAMPYCVYVASPGITTDRMSGDSTSIREIRDIPWEFRVHARTKSDGTSSKTVAADLAGEIIKIYGGHPTVAPTDLPLDNGNYLIAQYQTDFGIQSGEDEYVWNIQYLFRLDIPVKV